MINKELLDNFDIWNKRLHKLRCIWQYEWGTIEYRKKAFTIWSKLFMRIYRLGGVIMDNEEKTPKNMNAVELNILNKSKRNEKSKNP